MNIQGQDPRLWRAISAIEDGRPFLAAAYMNASQKLLGFFRLERIEDHGRFGGVRIRFLNRNCIIGLNSQLRDPKQKVLRVRLMDSLSLLAACRNVPNGSLWFNLHDIGEIPGLAFCDTRAEFKLVPDHTYLASYGQRDLARHYLEHDIPWSERIPRALWRGTTTGVPAGNSWRGLDRIALCELAAHHPDRFDAGITDIVQINDADEISAIRASGLMREFMPPSQFHRYRYQIDIDGNTNSWSGLFQKLLTGSAVMKVASRRGFRQWYYDRLVPWRNFVPVASDLSDLVDRHRWLVENDEAASNIGAAGRALALSMAPASELELARRTIIDTLSEPACEE
jgi:Glycosyl transferase family 90